MNKRKAFLALIMVCALCVLPVFGSFKAHADVAIAPNERDYTEPFGNISDAAGVLSYDEIIELNHVLGSAADKSGLDIGVCFLNSLDDGLSARSAADDYCESMFGKSGNAVALLIVLGTGNGDGAWQFSTTGKGISVMYDSAQVDTWAGMQSDIRNGNYTSAIRTYADSVIKFENEYSNSNNATRGPRPGLTGIIAAVVGLISGLIRGGALKSQLKSVAVATTASDCIKKDSFRLTRSGDVFLYRTVERKKRSTEDKTSTTHVSESGTTHGGVGGTF